MYFVPFSRDSRDARQLSRLLDDSVERFLGSAASRAATTEAAPRTPALDVAESDLAYTVKLDVPGVAKEDLKVSIDGRRVTVRTHRQAAAQTPAATPDGSSDSAVTAPAQDAQTVLADTDRIVYRERAAASYARSFTLPVEVEQADAGAKLENGVLTLTLPKRNARGAAQLTVN